MFVCHVQMFPERFSAGSLTKGRTYLEAMCCTENPMSLVGVQQRNAQIGYLLWSKPVSAKTTATEVLTKDMLSMSRTDKRNRLTFDNRNAQ